MKTKKAEVDSTKVVVSLILVLLVLVVLAFIFKEQISKTMQSIFKLSDNAQDQKICENIVTGRRCNKPSEGQWQSVAAPDGGWTDCKSSSTCWERVG